MQIEWKEKGEAMGRQRGEAPQPAGQGMLRGAEGCIVLPREGLQPVGVPFPTPRAPSRQ